MNWLRRKHPDLASIDPLLRFAKQARAEAARMPAGDARDQLLNEAEASELAIIERWLSPLAGVGQNGDRS
jgi:hypothetical protein